MSELRPKDIPTLRQMPHIINLAPDPEVAAAIALVALYGVVPRDALTMRRENVVHEAGIVRVIGVRFLLSGGMRKRKQIEYPVDELLYSLVRSSGDGIVFRGTRGGTLVTLPKYATLYQPWSAEQPAKLTWKKLSAFFEYSVLTSLTAKGLAALSSERGVKPAALYRYTKMLSNLEPGDWRRFQAFGSKTDSPDEAEERMRKYIHERLLPRRVYVK